MREIADELGVSSVLEGSVRRSGDRVRIVAQLVDAGADETLWSATYDRDLSDIFTIQSEVARKIARALEAELTPTEIARLEEGGDGEPGGLSACSGGPLPDQQIDHGKLEKRARQFSTGCRVGPKLCLRFRGSCAMLRAFRSGRKSEAGYHASA